MFGYVMAVLLVVASMLGSCDMKQTQWNVKEGTARDVLFSVEERGNGVIGVWLKNDETGFYCTTTDIVSEASLIELLELDKPVTIVYTDAQYELDHPCHNAEMSLKGSGFHTYIIKSIGFKRPIE